MAMLGEAIRTVASHRRVVHALFVTLALLQAVGFAVAGSGGAGGSGP